MEEEKNENKVPAVHQYFKDSLESDIFDQLSEQVKNPQAVIDSIKEDPASLSSNNSPLLENANVESILAPNITEDSSDSTDKPVICRIFASAGENSVEETPDKNFFDLIGPSELSVTSSSITSSLSRLTLSDSIADDLFVKKGVHLFSGRNTSAEADRRRDAWIPSSKTKQALMAAATAPPGTYVPDHSLLTTPGVVLQEDMVDNVYQAVNHYLGEAEASKRKVLTVNDVTQDERGLRELIQAECYRAAVNLTSRLLNMYGQGIGRAGHTSKHTLHSVQLWFTRIALLVKLHLWTVAWEEAEAWWDFDRPDLYFQFYSELYGGRPGTLVPFSFRLLLAELPQYVHRPDEGYSRLFSVLSTVRKILKNLQCGLAEDGSYIEITEEDRQQSKRLWQDREVRVHQSVINIAFQQKNYKLAIDTFKILLSHEKFQNDISKQRILLSALGRVFLQLGDVSVAKKYFDQSSALRPLSSDPEDSDLHELVDRGMIAVADGDYAKALEYFKNARNIFPTNVMVANNTAVCLLYEGQHTEAIKLLEEMIESDPHSTLYEGVILNLCTLYELEGSKSIEKKYKILKLIAQHKGDAFLLNCLKL